MSDTMTWAIIGAMATAIAALATTCYRLMLKLIKCHEVRVKYMEQQVDLVLTFRRTLEDQNSQQEEP